MCVGFVWSLCCGVVWFFVSFLVEQSSAEEGCVLCLFLKVLLVGLQSVIVAFTGQIHLSRDM